MLPALVLLALCTPLANAAGEWAAQTWSEHLPRICTTILLYHAARACVSSLARHTPTLTSAQVAHHGPSPISQAAPRLLLLQVACNESPATHFTCHAWRVGGL